MITEFKIQSKLYNVPFGSFELEIVFRNNPVSNLEFNKDVNPKEKNPKIFKNFCKSLF